MKTKFALILVLIGFNLGFAQLFSKERIINLENFDKKRFSYGYTLGLNMIDFNFDYKTNRRDILVKKNMGFNIGLLGNMRINDYFDVRLEPQVAFTTRSLNYDPSYFAGQTFTELDLVREVKSTYVYFPLLVKISTKRINNVKPYIIGGVAASLNISSNENNPDDNFAGEFRSTKNNYFYEIGIGIDLYFYFFKLSPSIRGVFAINDEIIPDDNPSSPWTRNIAGMRTRGVFLNFTFQ